MWRADDLHIAYRTELRMSIAGDRARSATYGWLRSGGLRHAANTRVTSTYSVKRLPTRMRSTGKHCDTRRHLSEPWQSPHLLRVNQPFKLLEKLTRKMPVPEQHSCFDISLLSPLGEVR